MGNMVVNHPMFADGDDICVFGPSTGGLQHQRTVFF